MKIDLTQQVEIDIFGSKNPLLDFYNEMQKGLQALFPNVDSDLVQMTIKGQCIKTHFNALKQYCKTFSTDYVMEAEYQVINESFKIDNTISPIMPKVSKPLRFSQMCELVILFQTWLNEYSFTVDLTITKEL